MAQNITTVGKFAEHVTAIGKLFIDNYFVIIGKDNDYYINCNGYDQPITVETKVAYNNVNGQWYFKFVKA